MLHPVRQQPPTTRDQAECESLMNVKAASMDGDGCEPGRSVLFVSSHELREVNHRTLRCSGLLFLHLLVNQAL